MSANITSASYKQLEERSKIKNLLLRWFLYFVLILFVTGGGSGIGASIVEHFCEQNSEVCFVDINVKESNKQNELLQVLK